MLRMKRMKAKAAALLLAAAALSGCMGNEIGQNDAPVISTVTGSSVTSAETTAPVTSSTTASTSVSVSESVTETETSVETSAPETETTPEETTTKETTTTTKATTTTTATTTTKAVNTSKRPVEEVQYDPNVSYMPSYGEWIGNIVVADKNEGYKVRGLPMCYGYLSTGAQYAQMINSYKQTFPDINFYNMSIPLASAFYIPPNMKNEFPDQHKLITNIGDNLDGSIANIDVYAALAPHLSEYLYSRTDHHWQPLGAYYAAQAFIKETGLPFADLSTYSKFVKENYCGSNYLYSNNLAAFKQYPDTFTYYKPKNSYTLNRYNGYFNFETKSDLFFDSIQGSGCYCTILGCDDRIFEIKTDVNNGRVLVVIKDSYGNALIPFFVGSFEKIYVVDMRYTYIKMTDLFKKVGATDVLFGQSLSSGYANDRINMMKNMMK